ncbi:hypothetical protein LIER_32269 [Lithospermum erythrorhizon]|uniref:DUF4283 domain-containing protein n=1 Tax=Lithospermum erythrorhizon TaxID=34254 RepID=A0AAV3RYR5_LITER
MDVVKPPLPPPPLDGDGKPPLPPLPLDGDDSFPENLLKDASLLQASLKSPTFSDPKPSSITFTQTLMNSTTAPTFSNLNFHHLPLAVGNQPGNTSMLGNSNVQNLTTSGPKLILTTFGPKLSYSAALRMNYKSVIMKIFSKKCRLMNLSRLSHVMIVDAYVQAFSMRMFKWTPDKESPLTPVWVTFSGLPLYFFTDEALLSIANSIDCNHLGHVRKDCKRKSDPLLASNKGAPAEGSSKHPFRRVVVPDEWDVTDVSTNKWVEEIFCVSELVEDVGAKEANVVDIQIGNIFDALVECGLIEEEELQALAKEV